MKTVILKSKKHAHLKNTSWLFIERVIRMILTLTVSIAMARYFGPEEFGLLNYLISFVALFTSISAFGLDTIVIMDLVKNPDKRDQVLGTTFILKLMASTAALVLMLATSSLLGNEFNLTAMMMIISAGNILLAFDAIDIYFQSIIKSRYIALVKITQICISSFLRLIMIYLEFELIYFVMMIFIDFLFITIGMNYVYRIAKLTPLNWRFNFKYAKRYITSSMPIVVADIAIAIYMKVDQVMIKELIDVSSVGIYAVSVTLTEAWYFIPSIIITTIYPLLIKAKEASAQNFEAKVQQVFNLMVWVALIISVITVIISQDVIEILYGDSYLASAIVLNIHIWTCVFVFLGVVSGRWYVIMKINKHILIRSLLGLSVNVSLNLLLIPKHGVIGASVSTFISYAIAYYFYDVLTSETRPVFKMKTKSLMFLNREIIKLN